MHLQAMRVMQRFISTPSGWAMAYLLIAWLVLQPLWEMSQYTARDTALLPEVVAWVWSLLRPGVAHADLLAEALPHHPFVAAAADDESRREPTGVIPPMRGLTANPDIEAALWVAKETVLKLAADSGTRLLDLPEVTNARAVVVDEARRVLWAFGHQILSAYDFDGTLRHHTAIPSPTDPGTEGDRVPLAVHAGNGTVWLGQHRHLYHLSAAGSILFGVRLDYPIHAIAIDPRQSWVWVGTQFQVLAYDEAGTERQRLALQREPQVEDLALRDVTSGEIWVALKDTLRRYAADGTLLLHTTVKGIERLASDGQGNVWGGSNRGLLLLNQQGQGPQATLRLHREQ